MHTSGTRTFNVENGKWKVGCVGVRGTANTAIIMSLNALPVSEVQYEDRQHSGIFEFLLPVLSYQNSIFDFVLKAISGKTHKSHLNNHHPLKAPPCT